MNISFCVKWRENLKQRNMTVWNTTNSLAHIHNIIITYRHIINIRQQATATPNAIYVTSFLAPEYTKHSVQHTHSMDGERHRQAKEREWDRIFRSMYDFCGCFTYKIRFARVFIYFFFFFPFAFHSVFNFFFFFIVYVLECFWEMKHTQNCMCIDIMHKTDIKSRNPALRQ